MSNGFKTTRGTSGGTKSSFKMTTTFINTMTTSTNWSSSGKPVSITPLLPLHSSTPGGREPPLVFRTNIEESASL